MVDITKFKVRVRVLANFVRNGSDLFFNFVRRIPGAGVPDGGIILSCRSVFANEKKKTNQQHSQSQQPNESQIAVESF